jgi:hypothetical protein
MYCCRPCLRVTDVTGVCGVDPSESPPLLGPVSEVEYLTRSPTDGPTVALILTTRDGRRVTLVPIRPEAWQHRQPSGLPGIWFVWRGN